MNWYTVYVSTTYGDYAVRQQAATYVAAISAAVDLLQRRYGKKRGFDVIRTAAIADTTDLTVHLGSKIVALPLPPYSPPPLPPVSGSGLIVPSRSIISSLGISKSLGLGGLSALAAILAGAGTAGAAFAWPTALTTGPRIGMTAVPSEATSGAGWSWNGGDGAIYSTGNDAVISGLNVSGHILINHTGVQVNDCQSYGKWVFTNKVAVFEYCRVVGPGIFGKAVWFDQPAAGCALRYSDLSQCEDGVYAHNTTGQTLTLYRNYVHDLSSGAGDPHYDGLQLNGGHYLVEENNLAVASDASSGITVDVGHNNTIVRKNWIQGGAYGLRMENTVSVVQIVDNKFGTHAFNETSVEGIIDTPVITGNTDKDGNNIDAEILAQIP